MDDLHQLATRLRGGGQSASAGLLSSLVRLLRATRAAATGVTRYGRPIANTRAVSASRQFCQLFRLNRAYGYTADEYYRFRMYDLPRAEQSLVVRLPANISIREHLYSRLAVDTGLLADKRRFYKAGAMAGLPLPVTVADFENGVVTWWGNDTLPHADLFLKRAASVGGAGASRWSFAGGYWSDGRERLSQTELIDHICRLSVGTPMVLQLCLRKDPSFEDLSPSSVCTARVTTIRAPGGEHAEILHAAFRMSVSGTVVDNFAAGGVACTVDVRTGVLSTGFKKRVSEAHIVVERHPETNALIAGRQLPHWHDVVALALRAHDVFPQFPSVGWDIAITETGLVVVEANYNWDVVFTQQVGGQPLGRTRWPHHLREWLDAAERGAD